MVFCFVAGNSSQSIYRKIINTVRVNLYTITWLTLIGVRRHCGSSLLHIMSPEIWKNKEVEYIWSLIMVIMLLNLMNDMSEIRFANRFSGRIFLCAINMNGKCCVYKILYFPWESRVSQNMVNFPKGKLYKMFKWKYKNKLTKQNYRGPLTDSKTILHGIA